MKRVAGEKRIRGARPREEDFYFAAKDREVIEETKVQM